MPITEKQKESVYKYKAKNIKRVPLDMQKTDYERLSAVAISTGKTINGYIKEAIAEKIQREDVKQ